MKNKQLIIIGGGTSITEGINKGLWGKLQNQFTFGLNYSYRFFKNSTCQLYVDNDFYAKEIKKGLEQHTLIIGKFHSSVAKIATPNTIMLPSAFKHNRNIISGVYKSSLVGLFALTLGIYLLDVGEIFLLGYDYGGRKIPNQTKQKTHFYQNDGKIRHRGIGKVNYYLSKGRVNRDFVPYKDEKKVKIYNVSMISKIPTFHNISYNLD